MKSKKKTDKRGEKQQTFRDQLITGQTDVGIVVEREEEDEQDLSAGQHRDMEVEERSMMDELRELKTLLEKERRARHDLEKKLQWAQRDIKKQERSSGEEAEETQTTEEESDMEHEEKEAEYKNEREGEVEENKGEPARKRMKTTETTKRAAMHAAVTAPPKHPTLASDDETDCALFVLQYERYEQRVELLAATGVVATVVPVKNCLTASALRCICEFELGTSTKAVTSEQLREYLWRLRAEPSEELLQEQRRKIKAAIFMTNSREKRVKAVKRMCQNLLGALEQAGNNEVLAVKQQCKLLTGAIRPINFRDYVENRWRTRG